MEHSLEPATERDTPARLLFWPHGRPLLALLPRSYNSLNSSCSARAAGASIREDVHPSWRRHVWVLAEAVVSIVQGYAQPAP